MFYLVFITLHLLTRVLFPLSSSDRVSASNLTRDSPAAVDFTFFPENAGNDYNHAEPSLFWRSVSWMPVGILLGSVLSSLFLIVGGALFKNAHDRMRVYGTFSTATKLAIVGILAYDLTRVYYFGRLFWGLTIASLVSMALSVWYDDAIMLIWIGSSSVTTTPPERPSTEMEIGEWRSTKESKISADW